MAAFLFITISIGKQSHSNTVALFVHLLVIPKFSKLQKESYFILLSSVEDYFPGYRLHSF